MGTFDEMGWQKMGAAFCGRGQIACISDAGMSINNGNKSLLVKKDRRMIASEATESPPQRLLKATLISASVGMNFLVTSS